MQANRDMAMKPSILVVDDHRIVANGIMSVLSVLNVEKTDHAITAAAALRALRNSTAGYDLVIVDLELPDTSGTQLISAIRAECPQTKIVVYTMHEEVWVVRELEVLHVEGIVLKGEPPSLLLDAVDTVLSGGTYFSSRYSGIKDKAGRSLLSEREHAVLQLMAQGKTSRRIAERLFLSENTIEYHRKSLMRRFAADNVAQLILIAERQGFISHDI